jgi:autotransporter-associated beta strand protein
MLSAPSAFGQFIYSEGFTGNNAAGWIGVTDGTSPGPRLTAGTAPDPSDPEYGAPQIDSVGNGWMRLATTTGNQANAVTLNTEVPSTGDTVTMTFDFTMWDTTSAPAADGLSVFAYDASINGPFSTNGTFTTGGYGGSLAYAMRTGINGMPGGYFGVAIDSYGNFLNDSEGRTGYPNGTNPTGGTNTTLMPNQIGLRGPGNGQTGYYVLAGTGINNYTAGNVSIASLNATTQNLQFPTYTTRPDQDAQDFRRASVVLDPNNNVSVYLQVGYTGNLSLLFTANLTAYGTRPSELGFGFGASTGGDNEVIEIRNVVVTASGGANSWYWSNADVGNKQTWTDTANLNWIGNGAVPGVGNNTNATVVFDSSDNQTGNYSVNITGSAKSVGQIIFSGNGSYNIASGLTGGNGAINFNTGNVGGPAFITMLNYPGGNANQTISANMGITGNNDLNIQNYISQTLTLSGNLNLNTHNVDYDTTGAVVDSGVVSGSGNVTVGDTSAQDTGIVTLSGNNTYTGTTTVDANATLVAASANALGSTTGNVTVTNGGGLGLAGNVTFANQQITITGAGGPNYDSGALVNVSGNNTWVGNITMAGNATIGAEAGSLTISAPIASGNNALTFDVDTNALLTDTGNISGGANTTITKTDGGTAILSGNNSTTGNIFVSQGVLQVNGNSSLGNTSATTVSSGGTFALGGTGGTYLNKTITLNGQGVAGEAGLWNAAGNNTWGNATVGSITLGSDSSIGGTNGTTLTIANVIAAGTSNITFGGGNGTVQINQAITSTGAVSNETISGGTLVTNAANLLVNNSTLTVASGATLNMTAGSETVGALSGAGNVSESNRVLTVGSENTSTTFGGILSGTGGNLTKVGTGTLTLAGANAYTGTTTVNAGAIQLGASNVFANSSNLTLNGGTFDVNGNADTLNTLAVQSSSTLDYQGDPGGQLTFTGNVTGTASQVLTIANWAGSINGGGSDFLQVDNANVSAATLANITFTGWGAGAQLINISGSIYEIVPTISGAYYWRGNHSNAWITSGNNTATNRNFTVGGANSIGPNSSGSIAYFGDTDGSGNTVANTSIVLGNTTTNTGVTVGTMIITGNVSAYSFSSANATVRSLTLTGTGGAFLTVAGNQSNVIGSNSTNAIGITLGSNLTISNNDSNTTGLTLGNVTGTAQTFTNGGCTTTVTGTGNTVVDMVMTGSGGLTDSGTGNLVLNKADTYTGNTTLNSGFLQMGSNTSVGNGTSNLTINGGTLGAIGGNRTAANAYSINSSFDVGNVDGSNLTLSGSGVLAAGNETLTVDSGIGATLSGVVSGSGNLTAGGPGNLTVTDGANTFSGNFGVTGGNVFVGVGNSTSIVGNHTTGLTMGAASTGNNSLGTGNVTVSGGELQFMSGTSFNATTTLATGASLVISGTGVANLTNGNIGTNDNFVDNGTIADSSTGNSTIHVNGNYTMNAGSSLTLSAGTLNLTPNGNFTTSGNATSSANISATSGSTLNINTSGGSGNFTLGTNDTLTADGSGTQVDVTAKSTSQINFNGTVVVSNNAQVVVSANNTVLGGGPVLMNGGDSTTAGTLVVQSGNLTVNANSSHAFANSPNVQFNGVSTFYGGAANTSITNLGTVTVNGGTVTLDGNTVDNLQGKNILIQSGGTLINGASNQIENNTGMTLAGGTWNVSNGNATAGFSEVLGSLTLSSTSTLVLGKSQSIINYASSSGQTWGTTYSSLMYVDNWNGTLTTGGGSDQLIFGNTSTALTTAQLNQIKFVNPTGLAAGTYNAVILSDGEVIPGTAFVPVPEPGTYAAGGTLAVLAAWWEWRRRRLTAKVRK